MRREIWFTLPDEIQTQKNEHARIKRKTVEEKVREKE